MRTETRNIYTAAELKTLDNGGEAFNKALKTYRNRAEQDLPAWNDEICASGRAAVKAAGLTLRDWSVDGGNPSASYYRIDGFYSGAGEFTDRKAREWINDRYNIALKGKRLNWRGREPGNCPFTGYCADDGVLDGIKAAIKSGDTLREAFEGIAVTVAKICEAEAAHEQTESFFLDQAEANSYEYDETGARI
jgi:hypothetical protein